MVEVVPGYENDYFKWLVDQRLNAIPYGMPQSGTWKQSSDGYKDISYESEHEYIELVIETEKRYPQFDFYKMARELIDIDKYK